MERGREPKVIKFVQLGEEIKSGRQSDCGEAAGTA